MKSKVDLFHGLLDMSLYWRVLSGNSGKSRCYGSLFALANQPYTRQTHVKGLSRHKTVMIIKVEPKSSCITALE